MGGSWELNTNLVWTSKGDLKGIEWELNGIGYL